MTERGGEGTAADVDVLFDRACQLGEGAAYETDGDTLFWFDILDRKLIEMAVGARRATIHDLPFMATALAPIDEDRQLVFAEDGLYVRERGAGTLTLLKAVEADDAVTRSNDARVHPSGAFWLGTMGRKVEKDAGSIYWFFRGELRRLYADLTVPNAICFSPDGRTGYFSDTGRKTLYRVDLDSASGLPVGEPAELHVGTGPDGPDGAVVDREGRIWNARYDGGRVDVFSPAGDLLRSIAMPARKTTCPAFVGPGLDRLVVTSASEHLDEAGKRADPLHGQTFILVPGVVGLDSPAVKAFAQ